MPSVALHVVESTFERGFESYLRSHSFNDFQGSAIVEHLLQRFGDRMFICGSAGVAPAILTGSGMVPDTLRSSIFVPPVTAGRFRKYLSE